SCKRVAITQINTGASEHMIEKEHDTTPQRPHRPIVWGNVAFLTLTPLAAAIAVPWYVLTHGITWVEIAACVFMWLLTGLSITAGYHRLFTHRSYSAPAPVRAFFAILGAATFENSVISWAAAHRFHHRHVDTDNDPYNAQEGFFYSHMGWVMVEGAKHDDTSNVPDLWKDPILRWQHRHAMVIGAVVNIVTTIILGLITGHMLGMFVFAFLLRMVLTHHFTFLINSAAHIWGSQPYSTAHSARDNWFLSFLSFGEGYHNYHHSFQADYRNGPRLYNWDPSKWLIWSLQKMGLATGLKRSPLDVTLGKLFEHARATFEQRLASIGETVDEWQVSFGETVDDWQATTLDQTAAAREALREHVVAAEKRCEEALAELKIARADLQAKISEGAGVIGRSRLRRQLREATRSARHALDTWQELGAAYLEGTQVSLSS
ncbi:MAG: fatty acid desaturase, partial [Acidobacteriota bacterium]|nr:fatty acid desaturase [Acidobacteriota bacterium]